MSRRLSIIALSILAVFATGCASQQQEQGMERSNIDQLFSAYSGQGMPGAALMVIRSGKPILVRTFGLANIEENIRVDGNTNFRLASVTKQFTATATLMLADRGRLRLDDPVIRYFPQLPAYANDVTIRHLLQHTSGIPDYEPLVEVTFPQQVHDRDVIEILSKTDATYFPPGSEFRYSNSGYAVLAMLVEKLSGKSFPDFLQDNIFGPLRMDNSIAFVDGENTVPNRAMGYTVDERGVTPSDQSAYSAVLGDGGIYTSLSDLFKWDQSLYTDRLLSDARRKEAWTPGLDDYGFGWWIDTFEGNKRYHHYGSTSGFRTFMQQFPNQRLTVIVLTNRAEPAVQSLGEAVARLYL